MLQRLLFLSVLLLSSCTSLRHSDLLDEDVLGAYSKRQASTVLELQSQELFNLPPARVKPTIAIYPNSFTDLTGQRKSNSTFALFLSLIHI